MRRFLALALAVSVSAAFAAPLPPESAPDPLYYPTKVGARRVMGVGDPVTLTNTYTVTLADPQPDGSVKVYEESDGAYDVLSVSPKGVYRTGSALNVKGKAVRDFRVMPRWEPECLVRPAGRWEHLAFDPAALRRMLARPLPGGARVGQSTHTYQVVGVEEVVVPAGTYRAVRVEKSTTDETEPGVRRRTAWWAPGVGVVRTAFDGRVLERLLSFEPGR